MKLTDFIPDVKLPIAEVGRHKIEAFTVSFEQARDHCLACRIKGRPEEGIIPGTYTRLVRDNGIIVMSDSLSERRDHEEFVQIASGLVLINGLGIGMSLQAVISKPDVQHVVVVEKDPDVIALVAPTYLKRYPDNLTIIKADAFEFELQQSPDVVWNDIWDTISDENVPEMDILEAKYPHAYWYDSWARERCGNFEELALQEMRGPSMETILENLKLSGYKVDSP